MRAVYCVEIKWILQLETVCGGESGGMNWFQMCIRNFPQEISQFLPEKGAEGKKFPRGWQTFLRMAGDDRGANEAGRLDFTAFQRFLGWF